MISTTNMEHYNIPGLKELWFETLGDPSIKIAIIDGIVDDAHPVLRDANLEIHETILGKDLALIGTSADHGTYVTSIIMGQHKSPIKGIAPKCTGLIFPVFKDDSDGEVTPCSQLDLARTILRAVDAGAHIINISSGEFSSSGIADTFLKDAIDYCTTKGVVVVAAAGNDGCECLHIPASIPSVLAVGATNVEGEPMNFSNWGQEYQYKGILAPGQNIKGAIVGGDLDERSGTSYATPIVSGILALLMSLQKKHGISPNGTEMKDLLLQNAIGCSHNTLQCKRLLTGKINLKNIVQKLVTKNHKNMVKQQENPIINSDALLENHPEILEKQEDYTDVESTAFPLTENAEDSIVNEGIKPSHCGCGGGENCTCNSEKKKTTRSVQKRQLVYALGTLSYDFISEARKKSLLQHAGERSNLNDPKQFIDYLEQNPFEAASVIWTLNLDNTPMYAIMPQGPYANEGYTRLAEFLKDQENEGAERISLPGLIVGQVRLQSGQIVPVVVPELRCMYNWSSSKLTDSILGRNANENTKNVFMSFLDRIYYDLRNMGITPTDRAINYAATNAMNAANVFVEAMESKMQLDTITTEKSPIHSGSSECFDVKLTFFDPENQLRSRKVYRFTVDVSETCPVMIGAVRSWYVR